MKKTFRLVLSAIFFLGLLGPASGVALARPANAVPGVLIGLVPVDLVKLATQQLEDMRNSPLAPNWDDTANFLPDVVPLYRPDLKDVAYYEFIVNQGKTAAGFIIVSTGSHDYPIPHWSSSGLSPTEELDALALGQGITLTQYYRLDALSYAGEDVKGNVVMSRDRLVKIDGLDSITPTPGDSTSSWKSTSTSDTQLDPNGWQETAAGPQTAGWTFSAWGSWLELKSGYAGSYGRLLTQLAQRAAPEWDALHNADQYGERLSKGDVRDIAVLCDAPSGAQTSGSGTADVSTSLVPRTGLKPLFHIVVNQDQFGIESPLDVQITCPTLGTITYHYFITPPMVRLMLPVITNSSGTTAAGNAAPASLSQVADWGPWSYAWSLNAWSDAPSYNQIDAHTPPNNTSCHSGCGSTALAMLFGWADYEARAANWWPYWKVRNGIYRVGGGTGADAVAPLFQDSGIDAISMEIRGYIGTICWGDSGATMPWNMSQAYRYLAPRTGARLETHYNIFGASDGALRSYAANSIRYRQTPAIIGTGWFGHYPLAMGYMERSRTTRDFFGAWHTDYQSNFWVDQGWGGAGNGWITADTWFSGELYP